MRFDGLKKETNTSRITNKRGKFKPIVRRLFFIIIFWGLKMDCKRSLSLQISLKYPWNGKCVQKIQDRASKDDIGEKRKSQRGQTAKQKVNHINRLAKDHVK